MRLIDADELLKYRTDHEMISTHYIYNAPTVTERKKGEWIVQDHVVCCSECGEPNMEWNYCPNCGADMRGEEA